MQVKSMQKKIALSMFELKLYIFSSIPFAFCKIILYGTNDLH
jgi:hypothetical protein